MCTLIAVMIDFSVPVKLSIRMQTETKRFVWIADVVIVGMLSGVGVYTAPIQMRRLIAYLHRIHKVIYGKTIYFFIYSIMNSTITLGISRKIIEVKLL